MLKSNYTSNYDMQFCANVLGTQFFLLIIILFIDVY